MRAGLLLFIVMAGAACARAQTPVRPFDRVEVGVFGATTVGHDQLDDYWDAGPAGAIDAVTPFYAGRASLLLRVGVDDAIDGRATSDFTSLFAALGWRVGRPLFADALRGDLGFHVGVTEWFFDSEDESAVRNEMELGVEGSVRADFEFATRWHAIAEASYQYTFTHERIEIAYVSLGFARTFTAPGWIRGVLQ